MLCVCTCHSQLPPVGGSALTQPVPFGGPPHREGPGCGVVPVWLPAAWAPRPGARLPAAWRALIRRCRPFLPSRRGPPYQCLGVRPFCFRYRPFFGGRRAPPLFVLSFGLSRPGERLPAVPSVLVLPPCPTRSVPWRVPYRFRYRLFLPYRSHPPVQCFRSVSFRRPLAVEDSDHCAKQVCAMLGIV